MELKGKLTTPKVYEVDNRIRLVDGKLCTAKIPYKDGLHSGPPEYIDVTEEVLNIICEGLTRRGF